MTKQCVYDCKLGGFSAYGGLTTKSKLLVIEGVSLSLKWVRGSGSLPIPFVFQGLIMVRGSVTNQIRFYPLHQTD